MKQIIYNAQTKETTFVDAPDVEIPIIEPTPTTEEVLDELITALVDKGVIY